MSQLRFVYFDCTTLAPYVEEISYENSLLVHQSSSLGLASLVHVFASLTFNAKAIYIVVAKRQLEHKDDPNYHGTPTADYYRLVPESFQVLVLNPVLSFVLTARCCCVGWCRLVSFF